MRRIGASVFISVFCLAFLVTETGCTFDPSANDNGVDDTPAAGQEGGVCLPDQTCDQGLECIDDVCVAGNNNAADETKTLLIFHNNSGPMCLAALDWLADVEPEYPGLVIEEHLTYEAGETELLEDLKAPFQASQGVSTGFGYLPIVFFQGQAFSGFDDEIAEALEELMSSQESALSGSIAETAN